MAYLVRTRYHVPNIRVFRVVWIYGEQVTDSSIVCVAYNLFFELCVAVVPQGQRNSVQYISVPSTRYLVHFKVFDKKGYTPPNVDKKGDTAFRRWRRLISPSNGL